MVSPLARSFSDTFPRPRLCPAVSSFLKVLAFFWFVSCAFAERPALFLVDNARLTQIRALSTTPGSAHQEALLAMRVRIDPGDPLSYEGAYANYKRAFYAREAAWLYLVTNETKYADLAYQALRDIYYAETPLDTKRPDQGTGLNRSQTLSSFALAYNWAYDGLTQAERDWVLSKINAGLDTYSAALTHTNIGTPWSSNWNGVVAGGHIIALVASDTWQARLHEYQSSRRILSNHLGTLGDTGWSQEGTTYFALSMENVLPALIAMKGIGDFAPLPVLTGRNLQQIVVHSSSLGSDVLSLTWGVGSGYFPQSGVLNSLLGLLPPQELPAFKWFYDHYCGQLSSLPAEKRYDSKNGMGSFFMALYPEALASTALSATHPKVLLDHSGGYVVRNRWQDGFDVIASLWTDAIFLNKAWDQGDALQLNILTQGTRFGGGPGAVTNPEAVTFSSLHVDGRSAVAGNVGKPVQRQHGANGAYVIADGDRAYSSLGISVQRHLLADFSASTDAVFSTLDAITSAGNHAYAWNLYVPGLTTTAGTEAGVPFLLITNPENGTYLKAWCLTPGATTRLGSNYVQFNINGGTEDLWVVLQVAPASTPASTLTLSGSGLDAVVTLSGRTLSLDRTARRASSSGLTDLRLLPDIAPSASPAAGLPPLAVQFAANASHQTDLTFLWTFSDGTTASGANVTKTFNTTGLHQATVLVTDPIGPVERRSIAVNVGDQPPQAIITAPATIALPGATLNFSAADSSDPEGMPLTYTWTFGDGSTAQGVGVSHAWSVENTYKVVLRAEDSAGNINTATVTIQIKDQNPAAEFSLEKVGGVAPFTARFDASASRDPEGMPLTYKWNFGDGTTANSSSSPLASHTYTTPGSYTVTLTATDPNGKTDQKIYRSVTVLNPSDALPAAAVTPGSYGGGLNYAVYQGPMPGGAVPDFNILQATHTGRVAQPDINVSPYEERYAIVFEGYLLAETTGVYDFEGDSRGQSKLLINGQPILTADPGKSGRGIAFLATGLHPIRIEVAFENAGPYGVERPFLDHRWRSPSAAGFSPIPPSAFHSNFQVFRPTLLVSPLQGHDGTSVFFEATMPSPDGNPLSYFWHFGDGSTSTARAVAHTYNLPSDLVQAYYTVRLTVTDSSGAAYTTGQPVLISKYAHTIGAQAQEADGPLPINRSEDTKLAFDRRTELRPFGQAINKSQEKGTLVTTRGFLNSTFHPSHLIDGNYRSRWIDSQAESWIEVRFEKDGVPQPYLISEYGFVLGPLHWTWFRDPGSWDIYGSNAPDPAPFSLSPVATNADWSLIHSQNNITYFAYEGLSNPKSDFARQGVFFTLPNNRAYSRYLFRLRNQGADYGSSVEIDELMLFDYLETPEAGNRPPAPSILLPSGLFEAPTSITFDATGTTDPDGDSLYYQWDFGDGHRTDRLEDLSQPNHSYQLPGTYNVVLTVTDGHGLSAVSTRSVIIGNATANTPPTVAISASHTVAPAGTLVSFSATVDDPDGDPISLLWEFGDGISATGSPTTHTFKKDGIYQIVLRASDNRGAISIATHSLTISHPNEGRPIISLSFGHFADAGTGPQVGAGMLPVGYWHALLQNPNPLLDSLGRATSIDISSDLSKLVVRNGTNAYRLDGDRVMLNTTGAPASGTRWSQTIDQIPYGLYDVILCSAGVEDNTSPLGFRIGGESRWLPAGYHPWAGTYTRSDSTDGSGIPANANYVVFENLDASSLTIEATGSARRNYLSGIQIVDKSGPSAPIIRRQPADLGIVAGHPATFSVSVYASPEPSYQWLRNGVSIPGATSAELTLSPSLSDDGALYHCVVTNSLGFSTTRTARLQVVDPALAAAPVIVEQPVSLFTQENDPAVFSVTATAHPEATYQWRRDGLDIPGATSSTLILSSSLEDNAAAFSCRVTNFLGTVTSSPAILSVTELDSAPVLLEQPADATEREYRIVTFSVLAAGKPAPTYQWRRDGVAIPGATTPELSFAITLNDNESTYDCVVANSLASITSSPATLSVIPVEPVINQPLSINFYNTDYSRVTTTTGVVPAPNWNNVHISLAGQEVGGLIAGNGGDTPVRLIFTGVRNTSNADTANGGPGDQLLNEGIKGDSSTNQTVTITLEDLALAFPRGFDLYVYTREDNARSFTLDAEGTWPVYHAARIGGIFDGEFTRITSTQSGAPGQGEYVLWSGIQADTLNLRSLALGSNTRGSIAGIQLIPLEANDAPTVSFLSPESGGAFLINQPLAFLVDANDDHGVTSVEFYLDGVLLATDSHPEDGWSCPWTGTTTGSHVMTAIAYDASGLASAPSELPFSLTPPANWQTPKEEFSLSAASWLGDSADNEITGVRILADGTLVYAANIGATQHGGLTPSLLHHATTQSGGVLLFMSPDGRTLLHVVRLASELFQIDIDAADNLYVAAGNDGLFKIDPATRTVLWRVPTTGPAHKVDVAPDGTSIVLTYSASYASGDSYVHIFANDSTTLGGFTGKGFTGDVAIDPINQRAFIVGFTNNHSGANPVQIAYLHARAYDGTVLWRDYDWPATWLDNHDGDSWQNLMADTRGYVVELAPDGRLYAGFEVAGGNMIFSKVPNNDVEARAPEVSLNLTLNVPLAGGDFYHQLTNTRDPHKSFVGIYDSATGDFINGQEFCTRYRETPSSIIANSFRFERGDLHIDDVGRVFVAGASAAGLPIEHDPIYEASPARSASERSFNPFGPGYYSGGAHLMVMSPDLSRRLYTTRLSGGSSYSVYSRSLPGWDFPLIAYGGQQSGYNPRVDYFWESGNVMYLLNPLQAESGGGKDAFYAVLGGANTLGRPQARLTTSHASGKAPLAVILSASTSSDLYGSPAGIASYQWDINGDGTTDTTTTTPSLSTTYLAQGTIAPSVTVTDHDGLTDTVNLLITVLAPDPEPTALFSATPTTGYVPLTVSFNASSSYDLDGNPPGIASYSWDFNDDGTPDATGLTANHLFSLVGTHRVRLTVTDFDGLSDSTTLDIFVEPENYAPVLLPDGDRTLFHPGSVTLSTQVTDDGKPATPGTVSTHWTQRFGPANAAPTPSAGLSTTLALATPGTYGYRVTTSDGELSTTARATAALVTPGPASKRVSIIYTNGSASLESSIPLGANIGGSPLANWKNIAASSDGLPRSGFKSSDGVLVSPEFSVTVGANVGIRGNGNTSSRDILIRNGSRLFPDYTGGDKFLRLHNTAAVFGPGATFSLLLYLGGSDTYGVYGLQARPDDDPSRENRIVNASFDALRNDAFIEGVHYLVIRDLIATSGELAFDVMALPGNPGTEANEHVLGGLQLIGHAPLANETPWVSPAPVSPLIWTANTTTLTADTDDDSHPAPLSLLWSQVSGPALATFDQPASATTTVSVPRPGQYLFRLSASDGENIGQGDVTLSVTDPDKLRSFLREQFPAHTENQLPTALEDTDGDGFSNLLEYALGLDPMNPDAAGAVGMGLEGTDLSLAFDRLLDRTDITYVVEVSDNLSTWTVLARSVNGAPFATENGGVVVQENVSGNLAAVIIRDDPANTSSSRFIRLRVTKP